MIFAKQTFENAQLLRRKTRLRGSTTFVLGKWLSGNRKQLSDLSVRGLISKGYPVESGRPAKKAVDKNYMVAVFHLPRLGVHGSSFVLNESQKIKQHGCRHLTHEIGFLISRIDGAVDCWPFSAPPSLAGWPFGRATCPISHGHGWKGKSTLPVIEARLPRCSQKLSSLLRQFPKFRRGLILPHPTYRSP